MSDVIINATLARLYGLTLEQAMLYNWIVDNSDDWEKEEIKGLEFTVINKREMLAQVSPLYKSITGLHSTLVKFNDMNLMIIGKDKSSFGVCLNQDLEYRWRLAHKEIEL